MLKQAEFRTHQMSLVDLLKQNIKIYLPFLHSYFFKFLSIRFCGC